LLGGLKLFGELVFFLTQLAHFIAQPDEILVVFLKLGHVRRWSGGGIFAGALFFQFGRLRNVASQLGPLPHVSREEQAERGKQNEHDDPGHKGLHNLAEYSPLGLDFEKEEDGDEHKYSN